MTTELQTLLLVGGKGTRLRERVPDLPKPMAPVDGKPFLERLLLMLAEQGLRNFIFSTGYMADKIIDHFGDGSRFGVRIQYVREETPLGTGGAVRWAREMYPAQRYLVMNGDSLCATDYAALLASVEQSDCQHGMLLHHVDNTSRYGRVTWSEEGGRVTGIGEKTGEEIPGWINAGVYVLQSEVLSRLPQGNSSLELELFPHMLDQGLLGFAGVGPFIDIGIPADYERLCAQYPQFFAQPQTSVE